MNDKNTSLEFSAIDGPARVIYNTTHKFSYCPSNFPYLYKWRVSGDAQIIKESVSPSCYSCEVKFGKQPVTITFEQSNPPGVPQVFNETKYVAVVKNL